MDIPKKLAFLRAVAGTDGADALAKAAGRAPELGAAIYPRALFAWLELLAEFDGDLPGTNAHASFRKTESGYEGFVTVGTELYDFKGVDIYHLAGSVAVALGANDEPIRTNASAPLLNKLGKQLDLLVKSRFTRELLDQEELAKTSWNAKMRRQYQFAPGADKPLTARDVDPEFTATAERHQLGTKGAKKYGDQPIALTQAQVEDRRRAYAKSIGLRPQYGVGGGNFPVANRNKLPYGNNFGIEHETAHAMMTPEGSTLNQYQRQLTAHAKPRPSYERAGEIDDAHEGAVRDENVANAIEPHVDRRAGVDPRSFASEFRDSLVTPEGYSDYEHFGPDDPGLTRDNIAPQGYREDAKHYVDKFDNGARFNKQGRIVPPKGIDARVNERGAGARPTTPFLKDEIKAGKPKVQLPGQAAKPNAPTPPTAATAKQPKPTAPQMGVTAPTKPGSTSVPQPAAPAKPATSTATLPGAAKPAVGSPKPPKPKLPGATVAKSDMSIACGVCGRKQFAGMRFTGCTCFEDLAKSVTVTEERNAVRLSFGDGWDIDGIQTIIASLRK